MWRSCCARQAGLKLIYRIYLDFSTQPSLGFIDDSGKSENALFMLEEKGQSGADRKAINSLQLRHAEEHISTHHTLTLEADRLQQQKTAPGPTVSQEQQTEATGAGQV